MTEEQLKQEIYNVLNTHNPTTCTDKPCKAVTALMSLFTHQLELAKIEAKIEIITQMIEYRDYCGRKFISNHMLQFYLSELTKQKEEIENARN